MIFTELFSHWYVCPKQVLPQCVRGKPGVMIMKEYSTPPRCPKLKFELLNAVLSRTKDTLFLVGILPLYNPLTQHGGISNELEKKSIIYKRVKVSLFGKTHFTIDTGKK